MVRNPAGRRRSKVSAALTTTAFDEVEELIRSARRRTLQSVNAGLIDLYWRVGETISRRISRDGWGHGTVAELAVHIERFHPGMRGFSAQNLWRMRQFFEAYRGVPELSTLLRELPWSSNLHILTKTKQANEREFYLRLAIQSGWSVRELARQIDGALFERTALARPKLSAALRTSQPRAEQEFKDAYLVEFVDLPEAHSERDLHRGLIRNLGRFLTELGRDFCFVASEYVVQVGSKDFVLDLLFFNRALNSLVAIELKIDEFKPSDYLEDCATEFQVQGLGCRPALRWRRLELSRLPRQQVAVKDMERRNYPRNAYRVLLTRARQGMVLFVPPGEEADPTQAPEFYDSTFGYLVEIGVPVLG